MPRFKRSVKKFSRPLQQVILDAVENIAAESELGELKKSDLHGIRVHKFIMNRQLTLLAYRIEHASIYLYAVGSHENFYKRLKNYLKEIGG